MRGMNRQAGERSKPGPGAIGVQGHEFRAAVDLRSRPIEPLQDRSNRAIAWLGALHRLTQRASTVLMLAISLGIGTLPAASQPALSANDEGRKRSQDIQTVGEQQPAIQSETLLRSRASWDGAPYTAYPAGQPELSVLKITIPPHTQLKWHTHPMPNAAYVLSGELTVERKEGGKTQHFTAGQVVAEMVDALHRGVTGDAPVTLIVFYAGIEGMPLSQ
jgi:quercetin dioxygenase-like cupin family protein